MIGAWARFFVLKYTGNFHYFVAIQSFIAIFQPAMCNGVSKMATAWFSDNERAMATAIGSLSIPIGCILGMITGPFYVYESDVDDKYGPDYTLGKDHIAHYMFIMAIIGSSFSIWIIFFYKEKPDSPPSHSALQSTKEEFNFKNDLKLILNNKNFLLMVIAFNMLYSVYTCLGAIVNNLVHPFGYTSADSSIFGVVFISSGLISSFITSGLLDKHKQYLKTLRVMCFGSLLTSSLMLFTVPMRSTPIVTGNIALIGIFILPMIPTCFSLSIELTYPVSEAMSNGFMMFFS